MYRRKKKWNKKWLSICTLVSWLVWHSSRMIYQDIFVFLCLMGVCLSDPFIVPTSAQLNSTQPSQNPPIRH